MASKTSWTAIRVSEETKKLLEELRELWTENALSHKSPLGCCETRSGQEAKRDVIGLDQVVRKLYAFWDDHRQRSSKKKYSAPSQSGADQV